MRRNYFNQSSYSITTSDFKHDQRSVEVQSTIMEEQETSHGAALKITPHQAMVGLSRMVEQSPLTYM